MQKILISNGCQITIISRVKKNENYITWDEIKRDGIPNCDAVINLAGENLMNVYSRWNEKFKNGLITSRIDTTKLLVDSIIKSKNRPLTWISSSAIGYYPASMTEAYTEDSLGGSGDFLVELCRDWERAATIPPHINFIRHATIRIGLVLGKDGGMIRNMMMPFKAGLGGRLGSGTQFMPWIHVHDVANLFYYALSQEHVSGILNGVAPECITNQCFTDTFAKALNRPAILPVPPFTLNILYGRERADAILNGQRVIPKRTLESGFKFKYGSIDEACKELVS